MVEPEPSHRRCVYLDVCALGRSFDDQTQMRIRAAHLACAEAAAANFLTCDDRLVRQCRRVGAQVWAGNPVEYCLKENLR